MAADPKSQARGKVQRAVARSIVTLGKATWFAPESLRVHRVWVCKLRLDKPNGLLTGTGVARTGARLRPADGAPRAGGGWRGVSRRSGQPPGRQEQAREGRNRPASAPPAEVAPRRWRESFLRADQAARQKQPGSNRNLDVRLVTEGDYLVELKPVEPPTAVVSLDTNRTLLV